MRRVFWCLVLGACGGVIEGQDGGGTSQPSCSDKTCPNDPVPTQQQIDSCQTSRARIENCNSVCGSWNDCVNKHIKDACGADGKLDSQKALDVVTVTCKLPQDCATCVSK